MTKKNCSNTYILFRFYPDLRKYPSMLIQSKNDFSSGLDV